jgi:DNA mismatch repair protein MutS
MIEKLEHFNSRGQSTMSNDSATKSLEEIIQAGVKLTPMMQQYYDIKKQYDGILLMFRMGDFYELFFEDARIASKILNISLTHRGKLGGFPIPMSGIPHHAAATYVDRITAQGQKVAICEQVEDPKATKGIVKRAVTQVVSPGMPYDLDKTESANHSYMACAFQHNNLFYLVMIDFTTGDFYGLTLTSVQDLIEKLYLVKPKEFISYLGQWDEFKEVNEFLSKTSILHTNLSEEYFQEKYTNIYIEKLIPTYKRDSVLKLHDNILCPIGALSYYICSTQSLESISHLRSFQMVSFEKDMKITYPTLVGLEIFPKTKETYKESILGHIDTTRTAMGTRKLKTIFQAPMRDKERIQRRLDTVEYFMNDYSLLQDVRNSLFEIRDIERIMAKVSTGKVNGPDLINLAKANIAFNDILKDLKKLPKGALEGLTSQEKSKLQALQEEIEKTINDEIGANLDKGNLIKDGCNAKRDKLCKLTKNATEALLELEAKYREATGIPNLRIKSNNVAGYFIEVSKSHTKKVPAEFVRRQTLVNSERYQSPELTEFEKEVVSAKDKLYKLEREIFDALVIMVKETAPEIMKLAHNIAMVDVYQCFAFSSKQNDFSRPELAKKKGVAITQGWHPLIKANLKDQFVNHDVTLDENIYFGLITGPNMAGKTTVMREVAIIQFLTQVGCFVPAEHAKVGLTDYIFSRLGASDDIIKGQSTFMVEMSETAEILRHATDESLIILDEIGRGTSTYDGLSIAWSLVEFFVNKTKALTLFSTHYHELIELVDGLENAKNLTVKTVNENGNVQFLYKLIEQGAAQSFGIHVAKLAGLPNEILNRSSQILAQLEADHQKMEIPCKNTEVNQLDMFTAGPEIIFEDTSSPLIEELTNLDITNMTPMQAMLKLHELKQTYIN